MFRCLSAVFVVAVLMSASHADWPVFRGDPLMSGVGQAKLPDRLAERWSFKCGDGVEGGDLDGQFYYVNAADGKPVWTFETDGEIHAGPNFHGNNILIGSHD